MAAAALCLAASVSRAESLEEAGRRERDRRAQSQEAQGSGRAIDEDALKAVPRDGGSGTFSAAPPRALLAPSIADDRARDAGHATARRRLEAQCARVQPVGVRLVQQASAYELCLARPTPQGRSGRSGPRGSAGIDSAPRCESQLARVRQTAAALGAALDDMEEAARRAGLLPGEVREVRERHGLDGRAWLEVDRALSRYR
jgi:hypothetical protein